MNIQERIMNLLEKVSFKKLLILCLLGILILASLFTGLSFLWSNLTEKVISITRQNRTKQFIIKSKELLSANKLGVLRQLIEHSEDEKQSEDYKEYLRQLSLVTGDKLKAFYTEIPLDLLRSLQKSQTEEFIENYNKQTSIIKDQDLYQYLIKRLRSENHIDTLNLVITEKEEDLKNQEISRLKKEQLSSTINSIITKYSNTYDTLDFNKGLAVPYVDIYIDYSSSQQERAASLLAAYKEYRSDGIKVINLVPCDDDNCYAAHKNFTGGVLGYAEIMNDWIRIHASNAHVRKVDQLLLTVKGALMASDPYWSEYEEQGIEHKVIYDNALAINYHLGSTISQEYVRTNPLINEDGIELFFEINQGEITVNKFPN